MCQEANSKYRGECFVGTYWRAGASVCGNERGCEKSHSHPQSGRPPSVGCGKDLQNPEGVWNYKSYVEFQLGDTRARSLTEGEKANGQTQVHDVVENNPLDAPEYTSRKVHSGHLEGCRDRMEAAIDLVQVRADRQHTQGSEQLVGNIKESIER